MLWVLNVGEGVEGGAAGLVGSGESGRADGQQGCPPQIISDKAGGVKRFLAIRLD